MEPGRASSGTGTSHLAPRLPDLALPPGTFVDIDVLVRGTPQEAIAIPGLGSELLEGMEFPNSPAFESWLLSERRRLLGAAEAALHEASLDRLASGEAAAAVGLAARLVKLNPYDENFQELLVRSYSEAGDRYAASRQVSACVELFRAELDREPGAALFRATEARAPTPLPARGAAVAISSRSAHTRNKMPQLLDHEPRHQERRAGFHVLGDQQLRQRVDLKGQ